MLEHKWITGRSASAIAASVEEAIHRGTAASGASLPTVRDLAERLKISPATVAAAYKTLRHRGLISGHGRRGTVVAHRTAPVVATRGFLPADASDLSSGAPDPVLLPPLDAALAAVDGWAPVRDTPPVLRSLGTFAAREFEADGIRARYLAIVSGGLDGIDRVLREHLCPGDSVAVEDPGAPEIVDLVKASACAAVPFAVDDEGPIPEQVDAALRRRCQAIVITPRGQNPTGAALTERRSRELQRIVRRFPDAVLIESDPASAVAGAAAFTLSAAARRWAVVRSTSSFLGDDLRVAVMAGDELTIARVQARQSLGPRRVSGILQQLALAMWSDPSSGRRLARAAEIYAQRRLALLDALSSRRIPAHGRSGLNVWIPVREESIVTHGLAQRGWAVAAGERFRIASAPAVRVTIAALAPPDAAQLAEALADVRRVRP